MRKKRWKNNEISSKLPEDEKADFTILPPRIVIYEILSFINKGVVSTVKEVPEKRYSLFGYFRKDGLRNLWFLYITVHIYRLDGKSLNRPTVTHEKFIPFSSIRRVQNLFLSLSSPILVERLSKLTCEMVSLEKLYIDMRRPQFFKWSDLFSQTSCFPRLKNLILRNIYDDVFQTLVSESNIEMWKKLQSIEIYARSKQNFQPLFSHQLSNLRNLYLSIAVQDVSDVCIDAPNLEEVVFCWNCRLGYVPLVPPVSENIIKMKKETMKNLKHLNLSDTRLWLELDCIFHSDSLETVRIYRMKYDSSSRWASTDSIFFNGAPFLKKFSLLRDDNFTFFLKEQKFPLFSKRILELAISTCKSLRNDYLLKNSEKEFSNLKVLSLEFVDNIVITGPWPVLDRLEKLILRGLDINDKFFEINCFSKMKILILSDLTKLKGHINKERSQDIIFPCLQELEIKCYQWSIYQMKDFEPDIFFGNLKFPVLQNLILSDFEKMKGRGWNRLPMLRSLKMRKGSPIEEEFWKNPPFPKFCEAKVFESIIV